MRLLTKWLRFLLRVVKWIRIATLFLVLVYGWNVLRQSNRSHSRHSLTSSTLVCQSFESLVNKKLLWIGQVLQKDEQMYKSMMGCQGGRSLTCQLEDLIGSIGPSNVPIWHENERCL
ncbi:MAG: hypothetical protein NT027_06275 [Proteobacteria bacterium]|nr:hypothetical protein [Pseudomonadota bacterium]